MIQTNIEDMASLPQTAAALVADEPDLVANLANLAALIYHTVSDLNWAGFYLIKDGVLVLGPFQGKPACVRLAVGRGVCGTAVAERRCLVVEDVHAFAGHIACDAASRSEMVVPLLREGVVVGVLDLDSPTVGRFAPIAPLVEAVAAVAEQCFCAKGGE